MMDLRGVTGRVSLIVCAFLALAGLSAPMKGESLVTSKVGPSSSVTDQDWLLLQQQVGSNNRYHPPEHLNDAHDQANLETRIKITGGVDNRTSLRTTSDQELQAMINAIGKIKCDGKKRRKANGKFVLNEAGGFVYEKTEPVGTGTMVIPDRPNPNRAFDTVYTAKHVFFNEDNSRRTNCKFISHGGKGKVVGISFPNDFPTRLNWEPGTVYPASDWTIVKTSKRLTERCSTVEPCGDYLPAAANTSPKILPWKLGTLSEEEYEKHQKLNYVEGSSKKIAHKIESYSLIGYVSKFTGYRKGYSGLVAVTGSRKDSSLMEALTMEVQTLKGRNVLLGYESACNSIRFSRYYTGMYVSVGCDTQKGMSGGPLIESKWVQEYDGNGNRVGKPYLIRTIRGVISAESTVEGTDKNYISVSTPRTIERLTDIHALNH